MATLLENVATTRKIVFSDLSKQSLPYEFAIFEFVEGKTLRFLIESNKLDQTQTTHIAHQLYVLIKNITQIPTNHFGQLDETGMNGTFTTWFSFLEAMQAPTTNTFVASSILPASIYLAPQTILSKHRDKFLVNNPRLITMDLNIDNIIITHDFKVVLIDLETFWSGDPLCAYAQFYALTQGMPLGEQFIKQLSLSFDEVFVFRFYALLDALNVLAYITRLNPATAIEAKPWGNPNTFVYLIEKNLNFLLTNC